MSSLKLPLRLHLVWIVLMSLNSCNSPSIVATQAIRKGDELNNQNRYDQSIEYYTQYLAQSKQLGIYRNANMEAEVLRKIAYAHTTQGRYQKALTHLQQALSIDSIQNNSLEVIEDYQQIGKVHAYLGNFREATKYLEWSLKLNSSMVGSVKTMKQRSVADTHLALAQLHLTIGNYALSQEQAKQAKERYNKLPDGQNGIMEVLLIEGILEREKGQLTQAEDYLTQSRKIAEKLQLNTSRHWQATGEVLRLRGDYVKALLHKTSALDQAKATGILPQIIISYMRLGDMYRQLGDQGKANMEYQKALELQSTMISQDTPGAASGQLFYGDNLAASFDFQLQSGSALGAGLVCLRMAESKFEQLKPDSAEYYLIKALDFLQSVQNTEGIVKAKLGLSRVSRIRGESNEAFALAHQAYTESVQPELKWQAVFEMGQAKQLEGSISEARKYYEDAVAGIDAIRANITIEDLKTSFTNTKVDVYDRLILLLLKNKSKWPDIDEKEAIERAFQYSERARARSFLDMLGNKKFNARTTEDTTLLNKEQFMCLKMSRLVQEINRRTGTASTTQDLLNELQSVQQAHKDILDQINLKNSAYRSVTIAEPPDIREIQNTIDSNTVLIQYWVSDSALIIWTLTNLELKVKIIEAERNEIHRLVNAYRNLIAFKIDDEGITKRIYTVLLGQVENELRSKLIIVPHRSLHFLPFQALRKPNKKFLVEDQVISYSPSSSIYLYCKNKRSEPGVQLLSMALGNRAIGDYSPLPGTQVEVDQLKKMYGTNAAAGEGIPEASFKQRASNFNYIHLATHATFNEKQPLYSYLLMEGDSENDGRLTVGEIFSLRLKSKVVTLSACETALGELGEADDLVGFSRAFIYAGTAGVLVTLWKVDDLTTAFLMIRYNQYLKSGYPVDESLTFAQRDLINRKITPTATRGLAEVDLDNRIVESVQRVHTNEVLSPYFWAPFVFVGSSGTDN